MFTLDNGKKIPRVKKKSRKVINIEENYINRKAIRTWLRTPV